MSQKTYEELVAENQNLKNKNVELKNEITQLKIQVDNQQLHINALNKYIFGSKREATPKEENIVEGTQCSIFGVLEDKELKEQVEAKTEDEGYKQGVELVLKQFTDVLSSLGVKEIETNGTTFNPEYHEAVSSVQDENLGEKEIKEVFKSNGKEVFENIINK